MYLLVLGYMCQICMLMRFEQPETSPTKMKWFQPTNENGEVTSLTRVVEPIIELLGVWVWVENRTDDSAEPENKVLLMS